MIVQGSITSIVKVTVGVAVNDCEDRPIVFTSETETTAASVPSFETTLSYIGFPETSLIAAWPEAGIFHK